MRHYLLLTTALFSLSLTARAATVEVLTPTLYSGQTFIAAFDAKPTGVTLGTTTLTPFPYKSGWRVVFPIGISTKAGTQTMTAHFQTGSVTKSVAVLRSKSNVINLPVPPKLNQTPQQLVTSLEATNSQISTVTQQVTSATKFSTPFALPLANNRKISSRFGEVRQTGSERITHLGVDFDQPKGSLVAAINAGVVAKAYVDPVYGNSVIVDHGQGIMTLYLHLDAIRVKTGEAVKKGTVVGTLGESGLASAPHLHLSIKIGGVSVDPLQFVAAFK